MKMKINFLFLMLLLTMSSNVVSQTSDASLTQDEVIEIALADPDVIEWIEDHDAEYGEPYLNEDGTWIMVFYGKYSELWVFIEDASGEILDMVEVFLDNYSQYIDDAITFIRSHEFLALANISHFSWSAYEYGGYISVYGSRSDDTYDWLNARLVFEVENDSIEFSLESMTANFDFGFPDVSFEEIGAIVGDLDEVVKFKDIVGEYHISMSMSYDSSAVDPYQYDLYYSPYQDYYIYAENGVADEGSDSIASSDEGFAAEDRYYGGCGVYHWLSISLSGEGEVLSIHGSTTANLSEDEVSVAILENDQISSWLDTLENYDIYFSYGGYGVWWINIYSLDTSDYAYMSFNETDNVISDLYIFIPTPATLSEDDVLNLILDNDAVAKWIDQVVQYEVRLYYNDRGSWYVYLYHPVIYQNYMWFELDDVTGEISNLYSNAVDNNLDLADIYDILSTQNLGDFLEDYPDAQIYIYYSNYYYNDQSDDTERTEDSSDEGSNGTATSSGGTSSEYVEDGIWYVYIYSQTFIEARLTLAIDDETGNVLYRQESFPIHAPVHNLLEVTDYVSDLEIMKDFNTLVKESYSYTYFYDGTWYNWQSGQSENGTTYYLSIELTDSNLDEYSAELARYGCGWYYDIASDAAAESDSAYRSQVRSNEQSQEGIPLGEFLVERPQSSTADPTPIFEFAIVFLSFFAISTILRKKLTL